MSDYTLVTFFTDFSSTFAILLSVTIAVKAINKNKHLAKQKNSIDFENLYLHDSLDEYYVVLSSCYKNKSKVSMLHWASIEQFQSDEAIAIRGILNVWERAAMAIEHNTFDEDIFYKSHYTLVQKLAKYTKEFREHYQRTRSKKAFKSFSDMAARWHFRRTNFKPEVIGY